MYYKPLLPDGSKVPLPWQIRLFYFNITWPLRDSPTTLIKFLGYLTVSLGFLVCFMVNEGQILYIIENISIDTNMSMEALSTCVILNECIFRIFNMAFNKNKFKEFLKEFFLSVYIEKRTNPVKWKQIHRGLIPATVHSYSYLLTMLSFQIVPFIKLGQGEKTLPYKMSLHYDLDEPAVYVLTLLYLYWTGSTVILFVIAETFLLTGFILHLNARYMILQEDIQECSKSLLLKVPKSRLALEFRKKLIELNERNCNLDRFAVLLDNIHNFRIFVIFAFSAVLLCVLSVQVASIGTSSTKIFGYVFWITAKISELLLFGIMGSTLIQTTDKMSSAYYLSNWEEIIYRSTNTKENIFLMKDLQIMMSLHGNPKRLTGYKFFDVSLDTVILVLQGAFSYYTCLRALKQSEEH